MNSRQRRRKARLAAMQPASVVALADAAVERADAERERQRQATNPRLRTVTELQRLYDRGDITQRQAQAGAWLLRQYRLANRLPRTTTAFGSVGGEEVITERVLDAERALSDAMRAAGLQGSAVVLHVAVLNEPLWGWAQGMRWKVPRALEALRDGLDGVAGVVR